MDPSQPAHNRHGSLDESNSPFHSDDCDTHFEDVEIPLHDGTIGKSSQSQTAADVYFFQTEPDLHRDWHNTSRKTINVILSSEVEIEASDGTRKRFNPGDVILAEDRTGRGHQTWGAGDQTRISMMLRLE